MFNPIARRVSINAMWTRRRQWARALLAALACLGGTAVGCGDDDKKGCERLCDNLARCELTIEGCVEGCVEEGRADRELTLALVQCVDEAPEGNCGAIQNCCSGAVPVGTGGVGPGGCS